MVLDVTSYATTHKQLAKTTVVVACLVLACDLTPCVPFVIEVLHVFSIAQVSAPGDLSSSQ